MAATVLHVKKLREVALPLGVDNGNAADLDMQKEDFPIYLSLLKIMSALNHNKKL